MDICMGFTGRLELGCLYGVDADLRPQLGRVSG